MKKLIMCLKYFSYLCEHKKNVFIQCIMISKEYSGWNKFDLIIHAFTHDLSKFRPDEFFPYAYYFNDEEYKKNNKDEFNKAWCKHKCRNRHHHEHYLETKIIKSTCCRSTRITSTLPMPEKHIREMVCDLKAMSMKFGGSAQQYYLENYYKEFVLHPQSRLYLEYLLDLNKEYIKDKKSIYTLDNVFILINKPYSNILNEIFIKKYNVDFMNYLSKNKGV